MRAWAAPGRVNIIGEHTDYNDGFVLPIALPMTVTCRAEPRADDLVTVSSRQRPGRSVRVAVPDLADARERVPEWVRYPLGVAAEFPRRGHRLGGVDLDLDGAVPIGAGLSSSAALTCSVAIALRDLFAPEVRDLGLVDIARAAENDYAGAPTGVLDQSAALLCTRGHALFLDVRAFTRGFSDGGRSGDARTGGARACDIGGGDAEVGGDPAGCEQIPFDLPRFGLELLVIDTGEPHRLAGGEYARRRAECEAAAAALRVPSLRDVDDPADLDRLDDAVGRRRARHVVTENARVLEIAEKLRSGADPRAAGPILTAGHASLRDDFEVSTPALDAAVEAALDAGAFGARMVGGGFGGSAIALVERERADAVVECVRERFDRSGFRSPRTFAVEPAAGAHRLA